MAERIENLNWKGPVLLFFIFLMAVFVVSVGKDSIAHKQNPEMQPSSSHIEENQEINV